ncbi:Increased DNA methylation 1 [Vigna angularis]|uniref:Increased DNA methylation 1 n=1 Tax=Phaseolus angularis TaxID=3914 RepID=A0A8T0K3M5_PHAAN|nr:Increased DNA methylation 1 [Vigna angularis]
MKGGCVRHSQLSVTMSQNHSPMDVHGEKCYEGTKRKREFRKKKLLVNDRVEVKSVEEGFLGSWHPGTVVRCEKQKRYVQYDNILDDDESKYLVDVVCVSSVLDGHSSSDFSNEHGFIRPLPPPFEFGERDLPFGVCVDVNYQEGWWEGVIFDHCNGMGERSVLFPDLGDEMKVGIHQLRITQDWDEATENWEPRGKWVFLEVVQECEKESLVAVSVKQIWYDIRTRKDFDNVKHWTCNDKDLWRALVVEVVGDYYLLTLEEVFPALNLPEEFLKETPEVNSVEPTDNFHCDSAHTNIFGSDIGVSDSPMEKSGNIICFQEECDRDPLMDGASEKKIILQEEPISPVQEIMIGAGEIKQAATCCSKKRKRRRSVSISWKPVVLSDVEFCPDVVNQYLLGCGSKTIRELLKIKVRKHLAYLGWKIEWRDRQPGRGCYRYKSPDAQDEKFYASIVEVLTHIQLESNVNTVHPQIDHSRMGSANDSDISLLLSDQPPNDQDLDVCPPKESVGHVDSDDLSQTLSHFLQKEPEVHTASPASVSTENRKHKHTRNSKAMMPKCDMKGSRTKCLRSSKRVLSAPSLSHQRPQNVVSWLMGRGVLMSRCKVYYWVEGGSNTDSAQGRITYYGIKCSCCQEIYGIRGFVNHAGGTGDCRPSASIFLKDGRSLLDCMIKEMHDDRTREDMNRPCNDLISLMVTGFAHHVVVRFAAKSKQKSLRMFFFLLAFNVNINQMLINSVMFMPSFVNSVDHVGCLKNREKDESRRYMENWFCGKECEQIYAGLQSLLGKPLIVGPNNLTWTLEKFNNSESSAAGSSLNDLLAEKYSKLSVALSVMHECFDPLKNPFTGRDIIDDVIFNSRSELNRLNFQGFYSVLLEQNEELISVATIRVFGQKVAEVPLVGTRIQYRRLGMCRILMNELEKNLMHLGVERLVLPAVPTVLETWTKSFGFAQMSNFDRSQFLDCAFLDFQETVLCQKFLTRIPSPQSGVTRETERKAQDVFTLRYRNEFDKSSSASEVDQAEEIERSRMDEQVLECVFTLPTS